MDKSLEIGGEKGDYFARYKASYVAGCLGPGFSGKVLDYGCGVGLLSACLLEHLPQASVHGYDVSAGSIAHVPYQIKQQGLFTSDIHQLRLEYDAVVVANVLHHVEPVERQAVIHNLRDFMAPGGKLIIFEHNPLNPLTRKVVRESPLDKGVVLLPAQETVSYLKSSDLKEIQLNYIVFFPKMLSALRWAEPLLRRLPLGAQYALQGSRKA